MASLSSASFRAAAKIAVAALLLSTCAPAVEAGGYVYDAAGRPASVKGYDGVVRSLVWDDEDRLLSSPGAVPGTQVYNGDGARVSRGGAKIRRSGSSVTSPVLSDGPGRHVAPGLGERTEPYYTMTYLNDRLGTTNALSDGSGNGLHATLETDAFGVPQSRWLQPGLVPASSPSGYAGGLGVRRRGRGAPPRGAPLVRRRRGEVPHARPGAAGAEPVGLLRERPGERGGPDGAEIGDCSQKPRRSVVPGLSYRRSEKIQIEGSE